MGLVVACSVLFQLTTDRLIDRLAHFEDCMVKEVWLSVGKGSLA